MAAVCLLVKDVDVVIQSIESLAYHGCYLVQSSNVTLR